MKRLILPIIIGVAGFTSLLVAFGPAQLALAADPTTTFAAIDQSKDQICEGAGLTGANCGGGGDGLNRVLKAALTILSAIAGFAAVVMVIIAGFKYITSGGDSSKLASAKSSLIWAIVGVAVVALAQTLVFFVIGKVI